MSDYRSITVKDLLDAFASNQPVPGGGSASALAGAVGASLLIMVATLPKTRGVSTDERAVLDAAAARLGPLRDSLMTLVDRDSDAYTSVLDAFRLPKQNDAEIDTRKEAVASAMKAATEAPLDTMRACSDVLQEARTVAKHGSPAAASDVAVAIELLSSAARGASRNVDTNLESVKDRDYVARVAGERDALAEAIRQDAERALEAL